MDKELRSYLDNLLLFHNDIQTEEREKYYSHASKARGVKKEKYICCIIDGMDQSKLLLPCLIQTAKAYAGAWRLKTHLTGVINHGREILAFVDVQQWPHDANFTMNIILQILIRMNEIPDTFYIQMDNCWRENKNKFVIVFLAVLVKADIFKKVKINFLMVGHTHEDVDQFFSCIRNFLFKHNVRTLEELLECIMESYTPKPHAELLKQVFDIRTWMADITIDLHNIINPHCFVLRKSSKGDVVLKYKNWTRDEEWKPSNNLDDGIVVLSADTIIPDTVPKLLTPSNERIQIDRLKTDIPKFFKSRVFEEHHKTSWKDFLEDKESLFKPPVEQPTSWPLKDLVSLKARQHAEKGDDQQRQMNGILDIPRPLNVPAEVEEVVVAQVEEIPLVYFGRYRNPQRLRETVQEVDDPYGAMKEGVFVAVHIKDAKKLPVIGKVTAVDEDMVHIEYMKGSWRTAWQPWKLRGGQIWSDVLPKACIILVDFAFNDGKLKTETVAFLKQKYSELTS